MSVSSRAHPRAGGENEGQGHRLIRRRGSSPRGRGKLEREAREVDSSRLIPARAGKTDMRTRTHTHTKAHPRAGGENAVVIGARNASAGSSPRGRGKLKETKSWQVRRRLIPARAGKTHPIGYRALDTRAHPRAGGENLPDARNHGRDAGSSPRGRGKHRRA